jgi:hypothetical protein
MKDVFKDLIRLPYENISMIVEGHEDVSLCLVYHVTTEVTAYDHIPDLVEFLVEGVFYTECNVSFGFARLKRIHY